MKHILLPLIIACFTFVGYSQNNTSSPYSKLGVGDIESAGFGKNTAMGGTGIALQSENSVNLVNPASLAFLDSTTVLLEIGIHGDFSKLTTSKESGTLYNANFSYLSFGFSASNKWSMALGLTPYSNVGYNIETTKQIDGSLTNYTYQLEGSGGISSLYFSNGFKINKNISLGLNTTYLFGPKEETQYLSLYDGHLFSITEQISNKYRGWKFDLGYQQTIPLKNKNLLVIGLTGNLPGMLKKRVDHFIVQSDYSENFTDTLINTEGDEEKINIPVNFGIGMAYNYKKVFTISADYKLDQWSGFNDDDYSDLSDNHTLAIGFEYKTNSKGTLSDLTYRGGFNLQRGYLTINNKNLKSYCVSAGIAFQMKNTRYNLYSEYSRRGTTTNGLIQEQTFRVGLNLTLMDLWFQKRKFN